MCYASPTVRPCPPTLFPDTEMDTTPLLLWSTALTSSPLEGLSGMAGALGAGAVLPCSDLRVECPNVKQYTALLEGQSPLLCRDPRERVVPVAWCQDGYSSYNNMASPIPGPPPL